MGLFSGRSDDGDDDDATEPSSPWENRGFVASAIVIGAVVVCVIIFVVLGRTGGDGQPGAGSTPTPSLTEPTDLPSDQPTEPPATPGDDQSSTPVTPPPVNSAVGGCKAKNPDQRIPRTAPPAVSWQFETDMLIPLQAQGGPATTDANGLRYCFAHSPTGAVLAAMVTLGQIRNPDLTQAVLQRRIVPGAGRTRALSENRTSPTPRNSGDVSQFTGFKVVDYLPARAIVAVAVQVDFRSVASLTLTLMWQGGDWKVVLQPDGSFNGDVAPDILGSLDGYVRFGGA